MTVPEIRPTFEIETPWSVAEAMKRLRTSITGPVATAVGCTTSQHAELYVPDAERHPWSPWLSIELEETPTGCRVRGRFSPHPHVWTLYMFGWFALAFAALVGSSWGYAQWATDARPWALISIPAAVVGASVLYAVSFIGQRLGAHQMVGLRSVVFEALAESPARPPESDEPPPDPVTMPGGR